VFVGGADVAVVDERVEIRSSEFVVGVAGMVVLRCYHHSSSPRSLRQRRLMEVLGVGRQKMAAENIVGLRLGVEVEEVPDVGMWCWVVFVRG
jgi:hypothetical protein